MPSLIKIVSALAVGATVVDATTCPPMGAVLPAPKSPSKSEAVKTAVKELTKALDAQASASFNSSALAFQVKSIHEDAPLMSYYFTPPNPGTGATSINENTIFRMASGTKLLTVLSSLLSDCVDMNESVLKYLPELNETAGHNPILSIPWEEISVDSLAAHLSGLGVDMAQDLDIIGSGPWKALGLPNVPNGTGPDCSGLPGTAVCTRADLLREVNRRPPVYSPYTNPVYSNIGLALLGYVVQAANNKSFPDVLQEKIFDVVGMNHSTLGTVPPREEMFIPEGDTIWNITLGAFDAAGGMYSTVADMIALAEGIMTHKFLSPLETRKWMKPDTTTASWGYVVGRPWEILRTDNLTSDGRLIDVYTKSGDLGLYHSMTVFVPDYDFVISMMMGGEEISANAYNPGIILSKVMQALVPAIDTASRDETTSTYLGEYVDESTNSSIVFNMNEGPGMLIKNWTIRGFDVLDHIPDYSFDILESGETVGNITVIARVYPTDLKNGDKFAWRAVFDTLTAEEDAELNDQLFFKNGYCQTWFQQDRKVYDYLSLDEFIFTLDGSEAKTVECPAFKVTLKKVD